MANVVKYAPVNRDNGERVATNGYYTGHKKGSTTPDAKADNPAYVVEEFTMRHGSMMQDATSGAMPKLAVGIKQTLTNCASSYTDSLISKEDNLSITYTATNSKTLPDSVTVKIGGVTKTVTTDYTWTKSTGVLTVAKAKITGDIEITVTAA